MAITDKEKGVWSLDQVYNKINQGSIWEYSVPGGDNLRLFSWGYNNLGQLGLNQSDNLKLSSPTQITGTTWRDVANTGGYKPSTSIASKTDGTLWSWGRNDQGQMGVNDRTHRSSPVQIPGDTWTGTFETTSAAYFHSLAIKTDGTLWSWGYNGAGELAQNNLTKRSSPVQIPGTTWAKTFTGYANGYGIKTDGTLWSWGHAANGALGQNQPHTSHLSSPVQVGSDTTWKMGSGSERNAMVIKTDGTFWAWGRNETGALGLNQGSNAGQNIATSSPVQIPGTTWSSVTTTQQGGLAIKTDGTLWAWGDNEWGTLGQNSNINYSSPVQIPGTTWNIVDSGGHYKVRAIKTDGTLWAWGLNEGGQAGVNDGINYSSPVQVPGTWDKIGGNNNTSFGLRQP